MNLITFAGKFPTAASAISGALLVVSFPPFNLGFMAWFALVPLMVAIQLSEKKNRFKLGMICGAVYFGGVMPWIYNVLVSYGHIWWPVAILLTLLLVVYLGFYIGLYGWAISFFGKSPETILISPPIFVVLEYFRTYLLTGVPWALLADSQSNYPAMIQLASITGSAGITFLIVLVNSTIAFAILKGKENKKSMQYPATAILLVLLNILWGYLQINRIENQGGIEINASVIQGNIDQSRKWSKAYRKKVVEIYKELSRKAAEKNSPNLIIWPETAVPFYFGRDMEETQELHSLSAKLGAVLVFGGLGREYAAGDGSYRFYNRAFTLQPDGVTSYYDKQHLVPFGEYVPLRKLLFFLDKISDAIPSDISRGKESLPIKTGSTYIGLQICGEIIFPELSRKLVNNGANIIINITNDAWFGRSGASAQHMSSLPFRAVENRVPIIRSANTGISGFVSATGKVYGTTDLFETTSTTRRVIIPPKNQTFYSRFGSLFTFLCAVSLIIALWFERKRNRA